MNGGGGDSPASWSWQENKKFELALAAVDEQRPDRWIKVASMIGGKKSAEDVERHYMALVEDLEFIESGRLDFYELKEEPNYVEFDDRAIYLTDEDQKLLASMKIY